MVDVSKLTKFTLSYLDDFQLETISEFEALCPEK